MTEKKQKQKDAEAKIKAALGDALAAEMGDIPKASITIEELKALELEDRKNKRKRIVRFIGVAAVIMLIFGAAVYAVWPQTAVPVDADKNTEQKVEESDGVVVINEGDGNGEAGITEYNETDWDKVSEYRYKYPTLCRCPYYLDSFVFNSFELIAYSTEEYDAIFYYKGIKEEKELIINDKHYKSGSNNTNMLDEEKIQQEMTSKGNIYILEDENHICCGVIFQKNCNITVKGKVTKDEIIKIFERIEI